MRDEYELEIDRSEDKTGYECFRAGVDTDGNPGRRTVGQIKYSADPSGKTKFGLIGKLWLFEELELRDRIRVGMKLLNAVAAEMDSPDYKMGGLFAIATVSDAEVRLVQSPSVAISTEVMKQLGAQVVPLTASSPAADKCVLLSFSSAAPMAGRIVSNVEEFGTFVEQCGTFVETGLKLENQSTSHIATVDAARTTLQTWSGYGLPLSGLSWKNLTSGDQRPNPFESFEFDLMAHVFTGSANLETTESKAKGPSVSQV